MKARRTALLVHGMGSNKRWWDPLQDSLQAIGIEPQPLSLSSLEDDGPEAWCREVRHHTGQKPLVLLMGHSLGAAVCLEVARTAPVAGVFLLALPPFFADFSPAPPPATGLSKAASARATSFLKTTCARASEITVECVHFVGSADPWVPVEQARRFPFRLVVIPGVGHGLNRSSVFQERLVHQLAVHRFC